MKKRAKKSQELKGISTWYNNKSDTIKCKWLKNHARNELKNSSCASSKAVYSTCSDTCSNYRGGLKRVISLCESNKVDKAQDYMDWANHQLWEAKTFKCSWPR